ncbi:hypothetical protein A3H85_02410 [Candidatus Daviesbacteria bacterium RIFCSPLOWO2_02_FULL_40_8]|uniref:Uncharacterized protein n=1 Tax=Candidatus Daviesbacteria bacterium RIFCSPLOWO2_01_FULL_40_24 TaxID=1797787 RepID=A0A1F5MKJ9_9BACT|nr:MAG: hypothetical protein A3B49_03780 [Candidatus Daviesbacteria bacterium RIFCSPLOWO2_01_FULL_40_24]OGE66728.1 MAG: hypothetical protein A3H85_02410 [Candidatus Daviesbacteria bacterium RIFCSPLOWO2_02_FULL_40_8]
MPKSTQFEKGFSGLLVLLFMVGVGGYLIASSAATSNSVLGENEEAKKAVKKIEEQSKEASKTKTEAVTTNGTKIKSQSEGAKSETEIETVDGRKIKTKVEDNKKTKIEIEQDRLKLKYVYEGGRLKLKTEDEAKEDKILDKREIDELTKEIEEELEDEGVKIASKSGKQAFSKNKIAALTDFPLSVDVNTRQLIVTTPAGQKVVTILPDQAVQNLLNTNIVNKIDTQAGEIAGGELGDLTGTVKIEIINDKIVYRIKGVKTHKFLGLIPVSAQTTAIVSAESGELVSQEQPLLTTVIDLLSP